MAILKRLSKVARELNVGISTIVEFLNSQNKEVSSNPNTKIGEELYMLLLQEFQKEKFEKEKADNVVIEQSERKVISINKEDSKKKVEKIIAKADKLSGPSVLGKIDLSPKEKPAEPVKEEATEKVESEEKVEESTANKEESVPKSETIKAEIKKLSGPTVLGKIDLPKTPGKTKPAQEEDPNKRKRKRIKKVNVEKAGKRLLKIKKNLLEHLKKQSQHQKKYKKKLKRL
jgi:translation initiation factor IF-2